MITRRWSNTLLWELYFFKRSSNSLFHEALAVSHYSISDGIWSVKREGSKGKWMCFNVLKCSCDSVALRNVLNCLLDFEDKTKRLHLLKNFKVLLQPYFYYRSPNWIISCSRSFNNIEMSSSDHIPFQRLKSECFLLDFVCRWTA